MADPIIAEDCSRVIICTICKTPKPETDFGFESANHLRRRSQCKKCRSKYSLEWARRKKANGIFQRGDETNYKTSGKSAKAKRVHQLRAAYRITRDEYDRLIASQYNLCAICGQPPEKRALDIDHDKETGIIRGLLCPRHNLGIGFFNHDPALLQAAIHYLSRPSPLRTSPLD